MKKLQKSLVFIMIVVTLFISCSCTQSQSNGDGADNSRNTNNEKAVKSETTIETTEKADYEMIKKFYDAIYDFDSLLRSNKYNSLKKELDKVFPVISEFEECAKNSNSKYKSYYEDVLSNLMYVGFTDSYSNIDSEMIDHYLTKSSHAYVITTYTEEILKVELPFKYDKEISINTDTYDNLRNHICNLVASAIDNGVNIYCENRESASFKEYYKYPISNNDECWLKLTYDFINLPNYSLGLFLSSSYSFSKITSFQIIGDASTIELNSNYEDSNGHGWSIMNFYSSKFTDKKNEVYNKIKDIFNNSNNVSFVINNDITINLGKDEIKSFKDNFEVFDAILKMCNTLKDPD